MIDGIAFLTFDEAVSLSKFLNATISKINDKLRRSKEFKACTIKGKKLRNKYYNTKYSRLERIIRYIFKLANMKMSSYCYMSNKGILYRIKQFHPEWLNTVNLDFIYQVRNCVYSHQSPEQAVLTIKKLKRSK